LTQGIGLRPQPWARVCRPVGPDTDSIFVGGTPALTLDQPEHNLPAFSLLEPLCDTCRNNEESEILSRHPIAFMSYVRQDDQHENGRLSQFHDRLSAEVRMQTGEAFAIFQDRNDIAWGQQWKQRIEESLDAATFLIPMITPAFFKSPACREELERFLKREEDLGRTDLILPVYYVECSLLSNEAKREGDPLAKVIAAR
jgi:hypothetical protein